MLFKGSYKALERLLRKENRVKGKKRGKIMEEVLLVVLGSLLGHTKAKELVILASSGAYS